MFLLLLFLSFCPVRYECEIAAGNETISKGENDASALLLPKQEALTFLRPTVVRSPTQMRKNLFPLNRDRLLSRRRISTRERTNRQKIPRIYPSQTKIPRGHFSQRGFLESSGRKRMPNLMGIKIRSPPTPPRITYPKNFPDTLKQRGILNEKPRLPQIDRMDPGNHPSFWDYPESDRAVKYPLTSSELESKLNYNQGLSLGYEGSLDAALKVLWSYRKKAYGSLLESSLVERQTPPKNSIRHITPWASSEEQEYQHPFNPLYYDGPLDTQEGVGTWPKTSSSGSRSIDHEHGKDNMGYEPSRTLTFNDDPFFHQRRVRNFSPQNTEFEARMSYGGGDKYRKFSSRDERRTLSGRVMPKDLSFRRTGSRILRKQLVKRSDTHLYDSDEEKPNDFTEVALDRVDEDGFIADEDYSLYINNGGQNADEETRDQMDLDNDLYFLEDQDYENDLVGFEDDAGGGENEEAYIDVFGLDNEYVEAEYIDGDYVYIDTEKEEDRRGLYVARMESLNDTLKLNRQGVLHLGPFSPDRKPLRNKRQRLHPRPPSGSLRPHRESKVGPQPSRTVSKPIKRIRVRIKDKTDSGTKRIRMKIKGVPDGLPLKKQAPGKRANQPGSSSSFSNNHKRRKIVKAPNYRPFRELKRKRKRPFIYQQTMNSGYDGIKNSAEGAKDIPGYDGTRTLTSESDELKQFGYRRENIPNYTTLSPTMGSVKGSLGWATLRQISNSLPDLNKAITVMSFVAFSVFVANLGINAIANTTSGVSFGRSSSSLDWFQDKPGLTLDGLIEEVDQLFETPETNHTGNYISTFNSIVTLVQDVYNMISDVTRDEIENTSQKVTNFLRRDFSTDDLPLGDISKGYLSRQLDKKDSYGQLENTCYRKLLCLSHNLTRQSANKDIRNKLIPFWTFGIGWLKNDESAMPVLLENLRAELAGQSGRDCQKLFSNCSDNTLVESFLSEVKDELLNTSSSLSREEGVPNGPTDNSLPKY